MCCYISPNIDQRVAERKIDEIFRACSEETVDYVLMGDMNAKSPLWGSPVTDQRGIYLEEGFAELNLVVLNDGLKPTFVRGQSISYIDVTSATTNMSRKIRNWEVLDDDPGTNHQYICFVVEDNITSRTKMGQIRAKDWEVFRTLLEMKAHREGEGQNVIGRFEKAIQEAYKGCLGPKIAVHDREMPYWWNQEISEARTSCGRIRRRLIRSRARLINGPEDVQVLEGEYREARRELKYLEEATLEEHSSRNGK